VRLQAGPVPLYFQLQRHLRERIEAGEFKAGGSLPTEGDLCEQYGVSRITVRHALDALAARGLISRRRGVGTFVAEAPGPVKSVTLTGSLDEMLAPAKDLSQKVLSRQVVQPPPLVCQALRLPEGERVVRVETLHCSGDGPFSWSELFLPESVGALVPESELNSGGAMVRVVEQALQQTITWAEQTIEPTIADRAVAEHLGIKPRAPVLKVVRTYYLEGNRPVATVIARYHPERYRYAVHLFPKRAM